MNPEKLWKEIAEFERPVEQYREHIEYMLEVLNMTPIEVRDFLNTRGINAWISDIYKVKNNERSNDGCTVTVHTTGEKEQVGKRQAG